MLTPVRRRWYRSLFWVAAAYDIALGVTFLFFSRQVFDWLDIEPAHPTYTSYISLIAVFLFVIGVAYALIARGDFYRNKDLITVGILYKLGYFFVALWYLLDGLYPHIIFFWVFGVADLVFAIAMIECRAYVGRHEKAWMDGQGGHVLT